MSKSEWNQQAALDELTRKIAYHLAKDYDLSPRSFAIKFVTGDFEYKIASGGIVRVYWTHIPVPSQKSEYESLMRRMLQQVALMIRDKFVGIVVYGGSGHPNSVKKELPELLSYDSFDYNTLYKVEMKHRRTGLVVSKEGLIGKKGVTVTRLVARCRIELSELVESLDKAVAEQGANEANVTKSESVSLCD